MQSTWVRSVLITVGRMTRILAITAQLKNHRGTFWKEKVLYALQQLDPKQGSSSKLHACDQEGQGNAEDKGCSEFFLPVLGLRF